MGKDLKVRIWGLFYSNPTVSVFWWDRPKNPKETVDKSEPTLVRDYHWIPQEYSSRGLALRVISLVPDQVLSCKSSSHTYFFPQRNTQ
jgi:hypothetical protein